MGDKTTATITDVQIVYQSGNAAGDVMYLKIEGNRLPPAGTTDAVVVVNRNDSGQEKHQWTGAIIERFPTNANANGKRALAKVVRGSDVVDKSDGDYNTGGSDEMDITIYNDPASTTDPGPSNAQGFSPPM